MSQATFIGRGAFRFNTLRSFDGAFRRERREDHEQAGIGPDDREEEHCDRCRDGKGVVRMRKDPIKRRMSRQKRLFVVFFLLFSTISRKAHLKKEEMGERRR